MSVVFVRRWVVAFGVAIAIIIIVALILQKPTEEAYFFPDNFSAVKFEWVDIENLTEYKACRNSIQGAVLIVDERGFVCERDDLSASGCCHSDGDTTKRFHCEGCQSTNCCSIYEHCVSCCLNPEQRSLLEAIITLGPVQRNLVSKTVSDQFELCLARCRTSSKIRDVINSRLADEVKKCSLDKDSKQSILTLLGKKFVEKHLPESDIGTGEAGPGASLSSVDVSISKAKEWLQSTLKQITKDFGLDPRLEAEGENLSTDMLEYMSFTQHVVHRGMDRELAVREKELQLELPTDKRSRTKPDLLACSCQSEALGKSVASILSRDPSRLNSICVQLYGRPLPSSLRRCIWKLRLLKVKKSHTYNQVQTELEEALEQFDKSLSLGQKELGISSAVHSPIEGIIRLVVQEAYQHRTGLQNELVTRQHSKLVIETLNVLYVHNRAYEPYYAMLLFPLISAFAYYERRDHDLGAVSTELALFFSLLLRNCFPTRLEIFSLADRVISRVKDEDGQLYDHLINVTQKNVSVEAREFLVNFIHTEKENAQLVEGEVSGGELNTMASDGRELLSHPIIFIRKWLAEGFVGVLGVHTLMLVWDQFFMSDWQHSVLQNICLVVIQLLREELLKTCDYHSVKRVLLNEACQLYTLDVQQGVIYLNNGGALRDVGTMGQATPPISFTDEGSIHDPHQASPDSQRARPQSRRSAVRSATPSHRVHSKHSVPVDQWVERSWMESLPTPSSLHEAFDVYIDEVRFIPDNATIVKVTGRILGPFWERPETLDVQDIEAFPQLDSSARCPWFKFKYAVNTPRSGLPVEAVLLLRVYTIDVDSGELVVVGNTALQLFIQEGEEAFLNVGGHQLRLRHVLPSTVAKLTVAAFEDIAIVPVSTLLVRLLPHSEEFVESPGYSSGYFFSENCKPSESERRIFRHYQDFHAYPPSVRGAAQDIREEEEGITNDTSSVMSNPVVEQWYKQRMSKHQLRHQVPKPIHLTTVVQYEQKQGLCVSVEHAHGLPSAQFVNAFIHVSPGPQAREEGATAEGHGGEEKALITHRDFNSPQRSPRWIDSPTVFHPHRDPLSSLIVRLYSLDAVYTPTTDRAGLGTVTGRKGNEPLLSPQGWSVMPLFDKNYVSAGIYHLPLLQGSPSSTFMEFLSRSPADQSFREAIRQKAHELQGTSSLVVRLWDAHYSKEQCIPLPRKEDLLSVGKPEKYKKTAHNMSGKPISDVILQSLNKQERKQGLTGQAYNTERLNYEDALNVVFMNKMEDVLLSSGFGPWE